MRKSKIRLSGSTPSYQLTTWNLHPFSLQIYISFTSRKILFSYECQEIKNIQYGLWKNWCLYRKYFIYACRVSFLHFNRSILLIFLVNISPLCIETVGLILFIIWVISLLSWVSKTSQQPVCCKLLFRNKLSWFKIFNTKPKRAI